MKVYKTIIYVIICVVLTFQLTLSQTTNSNIKISTTSNKDKIVLNYVVAKPSFVEIRIFGRDGHIFYAPEFSFLKTGSYKKEIENSKLPFGSYNVEMIIDHNKNNSVETGFNNTGNSNNFTYTNEENDLLSAALSYQGQFPDKSKSLFDTLLFNRRNYLDRGTVFLNSLIAYAQTLDSLNFIATVDSAAKYLPYSNTYYFVSQVLLYFHKYYPIGIKYGKKAIVHINDIPLPYRNSSLFIYQKSLGDNYMMVGDKNNAEKEYLDALTTFNQLTQYDRYSKDNTIVGIYDSLATISVGNKQYLDALEYYRKAILRTPDNMKEWELLQKSYNSSYNSDSGYMNYREQILATLPKTDNAVNTDYKNVGKLFPKFSLTTAQNKKYTFKDILGKITIVDFWAYWCGNCILERPILEKLYSEFKEKDFQILGFHTPLGIFKNYKEEKTLLTKFLKKHPTSFPNLIESKNDNIKKILKVNAIPTTFIIDKKGIIRFEEVGYDKDNFLSKIQNEIELLLREK